MAHTDTPDSTPPPAESALVFENPCDRPGCPHIFKYAGTKPFQRLAALVAQHAPHCIGRNFGATHRCDTSWQPKAATLYRFYQLEDDPAMYHNFGQCRVIGVIEDCPKCGALHPDDDECQANADATMYESDDEIPLRSVSAAKRCKKKATFKSSRTPASGDNEKNAAMDSPLLMPACKKKGARTEAQRHAVLNADPWTTSVAPHHGVCRGCKHIIKLDGRSRYYPGLWEKHRLRCEWVKKGRAQEESSVRESISKTDFPVNEAAESTLLAPRKSYYREQTV
ncbi:hypothetical protein B0H13DRAFT_2351772 [Mycena leptocephala]|nr:hypothetical protein B0H13DRAFT_2351772 [Mycena leptocephala]